MCDSWRIRIMMQPATVYFLAFAYGSAALASRTSTPAGCITVGSGSYSTIQAAVDSLSTTSTDAQCVFINPGVYQEQVYIAPRIANLTVYGYTTDASSYAHNAVNITHSSCLACGAANDDATATVRNWAAGTRFYNLNIENTNNKKSQALALSAYEDMQGYYGCGFYGYQDTVLSELGHQVYSRCYIQGAKDFIFGQYAQTWIDGCDIRVSGAGYITASGRVSSSGSSYYVINNSSVDAALYSNLGTGSTFLGRPWTEFARVCFQNTYLSSIVNSAGWISKTVSTEYVTFQEYGNTGPGANGPRASFATMLSSPVSILTILGSTYTSWVDISYLS